MKCSSKCHWFKCGHQTIQNLQCEIQQMLECENAMVKESDSNQTELQSYPEHNACMSMGGRAEVEHQLVFLPVP